MSSPTDVTRALRERVPRSARPGRRRYVFFDLYKEIFVTGSGSVISLHLSAELSGTCDSARLAARGVGRRFIR